MLVEELDEAVDEMDRCVIAPMNQRVLAVENLDTRIAFVERRDERVVLPQIRTGRSHVGDELSRMQQMEIPDGGGQHDQIAR